LDLIINNLIHVLDEDCWIRQRPIIPDNTRTPPISAVLLIVSPKNKKANIGLKIGSITEKIFTINNHITPIYQAPHAWGFLFVG